MHTAINLARHQASRASSTMSWRAYQCLCVHVLSASQSSVRVAMALHTLSFDPSTCWAVLAACVLSCTIRWSLFNAG